MSLEHSVYARCYSKTLVLGNSFESLQDTSTLVIHPVMKKLGAEAKKLAYVLVVNG
jgi:hypothetical protein